ncbi:DUF4446 family protein [Youngiibacter fragilis]|uniref:DUF4446 domain-containing protein n=1 Tax=Youngiibacter fragilis 232.1 TaxID=994573 RepID=V7I4Z8_9CLOT|nr:DUF4446 family protein [Youngiibacter fragilis]ETA81315.1 hypothetical protein T472_0207360 [Youngiibacter fragilis 232.1]
MDINYIYEMVYENIGVIAIALAALFLVYTVIFILLLVRTNKLQRKLTRLMKGSSAVSIEEMISSYQEKVETAKQNSEMCVDNLKLLNSQIRNCVQKVGVVRFKAFEDVGSDLSYSVALLDDHNDGVVITSLFGRNISTSYAKPIEKGESKYALSDEEMYAMNKAMGLEKKSRNGK